jgi:hypothetical protein
MERRRVMRALVVLFFAWPWLEHKARQQAVRKFFSLETDE